MYFDNIYVIFWNRTSQNSVHTRFQVNRTINIMLSCKICVKSLKNGTFGGRYGGVKWNPEAWHSFFIKKTLHWDLFDKSYLMFRTLIGWRRMDRLTSCDWRNPSDLPNFWHTFSTVLHRVFERQRCYMGIFEKITVGERIYVWKLNTVNYFFKYLKQCKIGMKFLNVNKNLKPYFVFFFYY